MHPFRFLRLTSVGAALALTVSAVPAIQAAEAVDPLLRQQVESIIQEYLQAHPEAVANALQEMERREREAEAQRAAAAIASHSKELYEDPTSPAGGNPKGSVTLVEFFDYQCGYCKRVAPEVAKLLQADPDVRLVYKELPILGPESVVAARAALAAASQGKYEAFHDALFAATERLTEDQIFSLASGIGLDVSKLKADMNSPAVVAALERNAKLAEAIGVHGTPALIAGTELIPGAANLAGLQGLVARARKSGGGS